MVPVISCSCLFGVQCMLEIVPSWTSQVFFIQIFWSKSYLNALLQTLVEQKSSLTYLVYSVVSLHFKVFIVDPAFFVEKWSLCKIRWDPSWLRAQKAGSSQSDQSVGYPMVPSSRISHQLVLIVLGSVQWDLVFWQKMGQWWCQRISSQLACWRLVAFSNYNKRQCRNAMLASFYNNYLHRVP